MLNRNSDAPLTGAILGLALAMLIWGSSFVAMKFALQAFHPLAAVFGRLFTASVFFIVFRKHFGEMHYQRGDWKLLGLMAFCEPCLYFSFETYALVYTSASEASMITGLLPLMTAIAAWFLLSERLTTRTLTGFVVAFIGIVGMSLTGRATESAPQPLLGNSLELLAMVCATGYTIASRRLSARYSPFFITAVQTFVGTAFFAPAMLIPGAPPVARAFTGGAALAVIYMGLMVSVAAYYLYNHALSRMPANKVSPYTNLIPVFSMLLGWWMLGEELTRWQYFSAALVIGGTLTTQVEFSGSWPRKLSGDVAGAAFDK